MFDRLFALGFIVLVASRYGASRQMDTYLLAIALPTLLGTLLAEVLYSTLVPAIGHLRLSPERTWEVLLWSALGLSGLTAAYVAVVVVATKLLLSNSLPPLLGTLSLLAAPLIFIGGLAGAFAAALVAHGRYLLAVFRIPIASLTTILIFVLLRPVSTSIQTALYSLLLGGAVALLVTGFAFVRRAGRPRVRPNRIHASFRDLAQLRSASLAQLAVGASSQAAVIVERIAGFSLGPGVISSLNYGRNLVTPPLLVGQSVATGSYPRLVSLAVGKDDRILDLLAASVAIVLFLLTPVTILLVALSHALSVLVYQRGAFAPDGVSQTGVAAGLLALTLIPISLSAVITRYLYAVLAAARVAAASLTSLVVYAAAVLFLRGPFSFVGLALASVISSMVLTILLAAAVPDARRLLANPVFLKSVRTVLLSGALTVAVIALAGVVDVGNDHFGREVAQAVLGMLCYVGASFFLGSSEFQAVISFALNLRRHG